MHPETVDAFELYDHVKAGAPDIEEITKWVTWDPHQTLKETAEWIEAKGKEFDDGEHATYVLRPKEGEHRGAIAGVSGIGVDWDRKTATFGIWLRKPFWGRGYSGERAERFLELAFDQLDLEAVIVSHAPENDQSERAISTYVDRFGGRREGLIRYAIPMGRRGQDVVRYSITSEEFQAATE